MDIESGSGVATVGTGTAVMEPRKKTKAKDAVAKETKKKGLVAARDAARATKVKAEKPPKVAAEETEPKAEPKVAKKAAATDADVRRQSCGRLASLFKLGADASRVQVLLAIREGGMTVTQLCEVVGQSQPALSHHLAMLRLADVVEFDRDGKSNIYRLTDRGGILMAAIDAAMRATGGGETGAA